METCVPGTVGDIVFTVCDIILVIWEHVCMCSQISVQVLLELQCGGISVNPLQVGKI